MSKRFALPASFAIAGVFAGSSVATAAASAAPASLAYTQYAAKPFFKGSKDYEVIGDLRTIGIDGTAGPSLFVTPKSEQQPAFSLDGSRIAFVRGNDLVVGNADGTGERVLPTPKNTSSETPTFSPDGHTVAFANDERGLMVIDTTAAQPKAKTLLKAGIGSRSARIFYEPRFTPDGTSVFYLRADFSLASRDFKVKVSIGSVHADGTHAERVLTGTSGLRALYGYALSPDGTRIAYVASPSWKRQPRHLRVLSLTEDTLTDLATADLANHSSFGTPAWSPDGTTLAVPQNASRPEHGAQLDLIETATGYRRVLTRIANGRLDEPAWVPAK